MLHWYHAYSLIAHTYNKQSTNWMSYNTYAQYVQLYCMLHDKTKNNTGLI